MTGSMSDSETSSTVNELQEHRGTSLESNDEYVQSAKDRLANSDGDIATTDPVFVFHGTPDLPQNANDTKVHGLAVIVPPVTRRWEYQVYEQAVVQEVLEEYDEDDEMSYLVRYIDGAEEVATFSDLLNITGGSEAIDSFNNQASSGSESATVASGRPPKRKAGRPKRITEIFDSDSSDDELSSLTRHRPTYRKDRLGPAPTLRSGRSSRGRSSQLNLSMASISSDMDLDDSDVGVQNRRRPKAGTRSARAAAQKHVNYDDLAGLKDLSDDSSDTGYQAKRRRLPRGASGPKFVLNPPRRQSPLGSRRSGRNAQFSKSMKEINEEDIPEQGVTKNTIKITGAKEHFKRIAEGDPFRERHCQTCDTCYEEGENEERGRMVYCQGCILSYHQKCLGYRAGRDHIVTKIGDRNFVLQCRRCINIAKQKDAIAPDQSMCFACKKSGPACHSFRDRRTTKQEQREREENGGEDPVVDVDSNKINRAGNVLFRCMTCYRACHLHHLDPRDGVALSVLAKEEDESIVRQRLKEYAQDWRCKTCISAPAEVDGLVAWRPNNIHSYEPGSTTEMVEEDAKEYLVKWKKLPHTKIMWMPGAWVWGVTSATMRKAFARRDNETNLPKMTTEDAVPEEFMRIDIVFDIEYTNVVKLHTPDVDRKRIKEVKRALVKFKGLGYEDVVWIEPPGPEEVDRYCDYKSAYEDWVLGLHIALPNTKQLNSHLARIRSKRFEDTLALTSQPNNLTGGTLMDYQLEGINWLYYQWFRQQNAILADEMGLGKTIQIIGFLATLKELHGCWPFLVVVPNSTCPNWRREIKQWAPSLRVVTYYGSAEAKKLAKKHELFPNGPKDLRCHVVVTSYDAAQDGEFRHVFHGIRWAGLIVDEGQRLKNDKSLLYSSLNALKAPFKVLMTGTPLQNNARELFNLLQFLDPREDAQAMDEQYAELDSEKLKELHEKLKPVFLRRTKAQVLTFLPSMAQIIVPVSLSILQKKLYRSILAKNPELIKSIIGSSRKTMKQTDRGNLNNILMQLRKCLCHPFVYSKQIEERSRDPIVSHRNLVDASSKFQLLELMLPLLQDRGHRVLIFSQFLDMLDMVEDFLDGLGLLHQRLDGSMGSLEKQRRIDEFNAPDSNLFAFLLSTRAGGVGINLATADTVIILDPDFNPHQDIQALSRAHRIGQKKKVLVFQLTTRSTAEEKIMQIGKKKMLLDHVLIEQMDADDDAGLDLESILRHGTEAIFADDDTQDIKYDVASIDKLLDRSQIEDTQADKEKSAESQFSFAKVWVNERASLEEGMEDVPEGDPDPSLWDKILKQREHEAAEEAELREKEFGRGRRKRENVNYTKEIGDDLALDLSPMPKKPVKRSAESDSDTDFQAHDEDSEDGEVPDGDDQEAGAELDQGDRERPSQSKVYGPGETRPFERAEMPLLTPRGAVLPNGRVGSEESDDGQYHPCIACNESHHTGYCPLKIAGVEYCNLCGLAHYGVARTCPHLNSVTQLRGMVDAIKQSPESSELKDMARKRVVGIIGDLNQRKRKKLEGQQRRDDPTQPVGPTGQGPLPPGIKPRQTVGDHASVYAQTNGHVGSGYFVNTAKRGKLNAAPPVPTQG